MLKGATIWVDVLILTLVVALAMTALLLVTPVGRDALVDQRVYLLEDLGYRVGTADYRTLHERLPSLIAQHVAATVGLITFLTLGVPGLLVVLQRWLFGSVRRPAELLTVGTHAAAVLMVRYIIVIPMNLWSQSMGQPLNASLLAPGIDEQSVVGSFLGSVDLFGVWWILVLATGLAVLYDRRTGGVAARLFVVYVLAALTAAVVKSSLGTQ
jgi:hypothetical protein